jgi:DHA1 family multidrug resistance protein-like MFS transporter
MTFVGPALGPVVSGFLQVYKTWRWTFYVLLWMAGGTEIFLLTLPETLPSAVLHRKARRIRSLPGHENVKAPNEASTHSLGDVFKTSFLRPWQLLFDPISFLVAIYYAVVYTLLYMLFSIYPIVFQQKRGWNAGIGELPLIGTVVGACIGGLALFLDSRRTRTKGNPDSEQVPEDRLPGAMAGGVLFPVTIFWFAWTAEYNSIHWAVPTVAGCFLATSILLIFVVFVNYLVDSYLQYAASALAANTILRSACAAASPLFTQYMFDTLGVGGAGSLVGGVGVLLMPIPFIFYKYGAAIRARSKYAVTDQARHTDEEASGHDRLPSTDSEKDDSVPERQ